MLTSVKGVYENGTIRLMEQVPHINHSEVVVTFLDESELEKEELVEKKVGVRLGSWEGLFKLSDDFNESMDDLKEYM